MWFWVSLPALGMLQLIFATLQVYFSCVPRSMLLVPLQLAFVLVAVRRGLGIYDPATYYTVPYLCSNRIEHVFVSSFSAVAILGYLSGAVMLFGVESVATPGSTNWQTAKATLDEYTAFAVGVCLGELLIMGEGVYELMFEHIEVEVVCRKYPKGCGRVLTSWSCATPLLESDSEGEMHHIASNREDSG